MAIPPYPQTRGEDYDDPRSLAAMRDELRRSAGGVRGQKLRTWGLALRRIEDWAWEVGGEGTPAEREAAMFDRLCEFVTGGGYITDLCGKYAVDREVLLCWVRKDPERDRRWKQAEVDRKEGHREEVLALWGDVMRAEPEEGPGWGDVLAAARDMAKYTGALPVGQGRGTTVNVNVGDWGERLRQARSRTGGGQDGTHSIEIDVTPEGVTLEQNESRDSGTVPREAHNLEKPCDSAPATITQSTRVIDVSREEGSERIAVAANSAVESPRPYEAPYAKADAVDVLADAASSDPANAAPQGIGGYGVPDVPPVPDVAAPARVAPRFVDESLLV